MGTYLDSNGQRHRPQDAVPQIVNEVAVRLRLPILLPAADVVDSMEVFRQRIERASEALRASSDEALLVLVVDAADNALLAASSEPSTSGSFVDLLLGLGELPTNVRLVFSCRTSRIDSLRLNERRLDVELLPLHPFTPKESKRHARALVGEQSARWFDEFHALSGANPRAQRYAIDGARGDPAGILDSLRPSPTAS